MSALSDSLSIAGRTAYDLAFQVSPIFFTGGIASKMPGAIASLLSFLPQPIQASNVTNTLANTATKATSIVQGAGLAASLITQQQAQFPIHFLPMTGATIINNAVGEYPFVNQAVAANAIIAQPLGISLTMIAPVSVPGGYYGKFAALTAIRNAFAAHNAQGGTYSVLTPAYLYTNCIMVGMTDVTSTQSRQQQIMWQISFTQPLVSNTQAQNVLSGLLQTLHSGAPPNTQLTAQGALAATRQPAGIVTYPIGTAPTIPALHP